MVIDTKLEKQDTRDIIASTYTQVRNTLEYQRKCLKIYFYLGVVINSFIPIAHRGIIYDCTKTILGI